MGILALTSTAMAQEPTPPPTEPIVTQPKVTTEVKTTTQTSNGTKVTEEKKVDDGTTDHSKVVGHFGVGYFGVNAQPIGLAGPDTTNGPARGVVQVPVIGARYWMTERIGIDAGLGFNFFSSGKSQKVGPVEREPDGPAVMAFALHAGLPIAFATGKHYKFLVVPELNFGYATQSEEAQNLQPGQPAPGKIHRSGVRFDVGARAGAEIQFGFIGVPELALQATVGLNFRYRRWGVSQEQSGTTTPQEITTGESALDLGTTVQSDPWALFTNNIAAIYYFP